MIKLEHTTGCICDSLTINGRETVDLPIKEVRDVVLDLISRCEDISILQDILMDYIDCNGKYEDLGHCEECGDHITKYTLEI